MSTLRSLRSLAGVARDAGEALVVVVGRKAGEGLCVVATMALNCETGLTREWRRKR